MSSFPRPTAHRLASAAAAALLAAAPASAQGPDPRTAPFSGLRAEGLAGYDALQDGGDQDSSSSNGIFYGVAAGYDFPVSRILLGVEGEFAGSTTDTRTDGIAVAGDRLVLDAGRDLYAGLRVGFPLGDTVLGYLKGGYTNARADIRYTQGTVSVRDHADLDGFRLGAGLEYRLRGQTFVKGEYRYSNYSSVEGYDTDVDRHQIVAGIGVRF